MAAYDTIIRNGTLIDGSGADAYVGDLAIADGKIAAIGKVEGDAKVEVDAAGLAVQPSFGVARGIYAGQGPGDGEQALCRAVHADRARRRGRPGAPAAVRIDCRR